MNNYLKSVNSAPLYGIVAIVLGFVVIFCIYYIVKSYRVGLKIGMSKEVLDTTIRSSALFTLVPAISILLGVISLSGSLGIPLSWLRLSVIGNLPYETVAAGAASEAMGTTLDPTKLTTQNMVTIMMVMTTGIIFGTIIAIPFTKPYAKRCMQKKGSGIDITSSKPSFANWAMVAMFIGMCASFVGSYISLFLRSLLNGNVTKASSVQLITALVSAAIMTLFRYLIDKKGLKRLEDFAVSASMLCGMAAASITALL